MVDRMRARARKSPCCRRHRPSACYNHRHVSRADGQDCHRHRRDERHRARGDAQKLVAAGASVVAVGRDAAALAQVAAPRWRRTRDSRRPWWPTSPMAGRPAASSTPPLSASAASTCWSTPPASSRWAPSRPPPTTTGSACSAVNATAPFRLMHAAVPHLLDAQGRRGQRVEREWAALVRRRLAYCVSKAALDQLTRCAALELAPKGVRVNAVNPGVVVTNLHRRCGHGRGSLRGVSRARRRRRTRLAGPGRPRKSPT